MKKTANHKRLICLCNSVPAGEIIGILRSGALTRAEVQQITSAGTRCGRCIPEIDALVAEYGQQPAKNLQLRIIFE